MSRLNTFTVPLRSVLLVFVYTGFPGKKFHCMYSFLKPAVVLEHNMKVISSNESSKG